MNKTLLIICGSTATGKTTLGLKLAQKFSSKGGGEIISADSRQVYRGMDVGTGKDFPVPNLKLNPPAGGQNSKLNIKNKDYQIGYFLFDKTPIWLLDIVKPDQKFSVAHWVGFAKLVIQDIWKRGKLPIIVGGTGFWIKALIMGVDSLGVKPDWKLRQELSNKTIEQLREELKKLDPQRLQRMNKSDRNNSRRLIRAIEISLASHQPPATRTGNWQTLSSSSLSGLGVEDLSSGRRLETGNILIIGLKTKNYQSLYNSINKRVEQRLKQGAQKEVEALFKKYSWKNSVLESTIGYKEWEEFFKKKKSLKETIERWKFDEHRLARRQATWFKKQKNINWFDIDKKGWQEDIVKIVNEWYS